MSFDHRKSIRLPDYDYSAPGIYFVTICTWQKIPLFGDVVDGVMNLNAMGRRVETIWREVTIPGVAHVDAYVVMPNHFHGIVVVDDAVGVMPNDIFRAIRESPLRGSSDELNKLQRRKMLLSLLIGRFKMNASKQINVLRNNPRTPVWQRSYWDRVIRNENELDVVRAYIHNNPSQWTTDKLYSETP